MQGANHRAGGVAACMIGYTALASHHAPLIEAAPIASLVVLYPFALWGLQQATSTIILAACGTR